MKKQENVKVLEKIDMFDLQFNHYPQILQWKDPNKIVLEYAYRNRNSYFRIHYNKKWNVEEKWIVEGNINNDYSFSYISTTFQESYEYLKKTIRKHRLRALT